MAISEFTEWLRTRTNKYERPFQENTITAYRDAARALHRWMTKQKSTTTSPRVTRLS